MSNGFQASERQRTLYYQRETFCTVELDLKRSWEHPESRHFGKLFWESHAFGPPSNKIQEDRQPHAIPTLDLASEKFKQRRHYPNEQGLYSSND